VVASPSSGNSNEKEISEKRIYEVDFVNHQVVHGAPQMFFLFVCLF